MVFVYNVFFVWWLLCCVCLFVCFSMCAVWCFLCMVFVYSVCMVFWCFGLVFLVWCFCRLSLSGVFVWRLFVCGVLLFCNVLLNVPVGLVIFCVVFMYGVVVW